MPPSRSPFLSRKAFAMARAIVLAMLAFLITSACVMDNTTFNKEQWRIEGEKDLETTKRWEQMEALIDVIKSDMTRKEVINLLGAPGRTQDEGEIRRETYYLGRSPLNMEVTIFVIKYKNDRVQESYLTR